jgi:hypothetical protein
VEKDGIGAWMKTITMFIWKGKECETVGWGMGMGMGARLTGDNMKIGLERGWRLGIEDMMV